MLSASFMWMESDAINIDGMVRLFRGEGNYNDDINSQDLTLSGSGGSFPTDTLPTAAPGAQPRQMMYFNGNGKAHGSATGLPGGAAPRTIIGWFKKDADLVSTGPFGYGAGGVCNNAYYVYIYVFSNFNRLALDQWCQYEGINPIINLVAVDTWYHLAISWDGTNNKAYVNGALVGTGIPDAPPNTLVSSDIQVARATIGGNPVLSTSHFKGYVADFAIFNRALSDTEVASIYNAPEGLKSQANSAAGDSCLTGSSTPPSGLACDATTSTYKIAVGSSCSSNSDCASGLCDSNNICKVADGDSCSSNSDCTSAYCDTSTNVCATAPVLDPCVGNNCSGHGRCYATSVSSSRCHCENTFVEVMNGNKPSCACPSQTELKPDINRCISTTSPPTSAPTNEPTKSPTSNPTVSMTASPSASQNDDNCVDSSLALKITVNGELKNKFCTWVARKKTESRCAMDTVSSHCPITCAKYGGNCNVDSTARIKFTKEDGSSVMRYCTWIASKPNKRCEYDGAVETCRNTCKEFSVRAV